MLAIPVPTRQQSVQIYEGERVSLLIYSQLLVLEDPFSEKSHSFNWSNYLFSNVEALVVFILACIWLASDPASTEKAFRRYFSGYRLNTAGELFTRIAKRPSPIRELTLVMSIFRVVSCITEIYGTYYMKPLYLLPFLVVELLRFFSLISLHVTAMQVLKENTQELGQVTLWTLAGSFILFVWLYLWMCVYSLYKVLRRLQSLQKSTVLAVRPRMEPVFQNEYPPKLMPAYYPYTQPIAPVY